MKDIKLPNEVTLILDKLNLRGFEAFVVGGCVRDHLMGLKPHDYDITTNALPNEVLDVFKDFHTIETGLKHGTITVRVNHQSFEITTYRLETKYSDHRHPDEVSFSKTLLEDLKRRDFTINSMAYNQGEGLIDPFGGQEDILNKTIRCVGDPNQRFEEDALRILRCLRFASRYDFFIESNSNEALFNKKDLLRSISSERIVNEFNEILCSNNVIKYLNDYRDIYLTFLSELEVMFEYDQNNKYHCYNLWMHTLNVVNQVKNDINTRWAALLHDIGKPATKTVDEETGYYHFYGHPSVSESISRIILNRLKFSNRDKDEILFLIKLHDYPIESRKTIKKVLNQCDISTFDKLIDLKKADNHSTKPEYHMENSYYQDILNTAHQIINNQEAFRIADLAINGHDLIDLGVEQTKIGTILKELLDKVLSEELENTKNHLIEYIKENYIW